MPINETAELSRCYPTDDLKLLSLLGINFEREAETATAQYKAARRRVRYVEHRNKLVRATNRELREKLDAAQQRAKEQSSKCRELENRIIKAAQENTELQATIRALNAALSVANKPANTKMPPAGTWAQRMQMKRF